MTDPKIFALIIGTEILNRRRIDKHFDFMTKIVGSYGLKLSGSLTIEDDPALIVQMIKFLASQPNSIIFSFGGIGSTPDDYTRKCAAIALRDGELYTHPEARAIIEERLGGRAYPHPIHMADLPRGAELIENPVNQMPAFSLDERYFFMPGFPEMSHPMVEAILKKLFREKKAYRRHTLTALCRENELIDVMKQMPEGVEFSSLPKLYTDGWRVSISVASHDDTLAQEAIQMYIDELERKKIPYSMIDESNA
jgi:molybdopterin-biosynthesis enzyme MoeA-like protein